MTRAALVRSLRVLRFHRLRRYNVALAALVAAACVGDDGGESVVGVVERSVLAADAGGESTGPYTLGRVVKPGRRRYDQFAWLGTHNSFAHRGRYPVVPNQDLSIPNQLREGVRLIQYDVWLVRQRLVDDVLVFERYPTNDTKVRNLLLTGVPLQAVVGHLNDDGAFVPPAPGRTFLDLEQALRAVEAFLSGDGQNAVVTINIQNELPSQHRDSLFAARRKSGLEARMFFARDDSVNSAIPAPEGQKGGWIVSRYGLPPVKLMADNGKNVVWQPPSVRTVFGRKSINPATWTEEKEGPIRDFLVPLFRMPHHRELPNAVLASGDNSYPTIRDHVYDVLRDWRRLPNVVTFDFVNLGANAAAGLTTWATRYLAQEDLDELWREAITPSLELNREPSEDGWFNSDVKVVRMSSAEGHDVDRAVAGSWRDDDPPGTRPTDFGLYDPANPGITFTEEGRHTLGFAVVDAVYGRRSSHMLAPIRIDKTPPDVVVELDAPPLWPPNGKPVEVTVSGAAMDDLSGLADDGLRYEVIDEYGAHEPFGSFTTDSEGGYSFSVELIVGRRGNDRDGRAYRIEVTATDKANNSTTAAVMVTVAHDRRSRLDQTSSFDPGDPEPVPDFLFDQSLPDDFDD